MENNKTRYTLSILFVLFISALFILACKKNSASPENSSAGAVASNTVTANGTRDELSKDSIFLYAKELYYWNTSLPTYDVFKPRTYASNETELYALTQFSNDPATGKPYEYVAGSNTPKYSFIDYLSSTAKTAALKADINGTANDYGFSVFYDSVNDLRIKYVYSNSPADQKGLTRGCRITSINGNTSLSYTSSMVTFLNDNLFGTNASVSLVIIDLNGNTKNVVVNRSTYTVNPVLYTNVYTENGKKVGYIVFNSYTSNVSAILNTIFSSFASQGVSELIVDLRYNGGGYVSTASQMINLIAPQAQTGNTMFTYYYNQYLQNLTTAQRKASILVNQPLLDDAGKLEPYTGGVNGRYATYADLDYTPGASANIERFSKLGTLNVSRVYFIVTGGTASASELTINSLKPVMDVKLIGATTYGKPVGFFPIRIDKFDLYIPEFETKNQIGVGGYYAGLTVDKQATDNLKKDWGDENENMLYYALQYAKNGTFLVDPPKVASLSAKSVAPSESLTTDETREIQNNLDQGHFQGMIGKPAKRF